MVEIRKLQSLQPKVQIRALAVQREQPAPSVVKKTSAELGYPRYKRYAGKSNVRSVGRERFFNVIERRNRDFPAPTPQPTPCILWQGSLDSDGYGRITKWIEGPDRQRRRQLGVHRHIMEVFLQRVLRPEEIVLHACDNRLCYRIDHLSIGTTQDNTADMVAKGRNSKPPINVFHGSAHPMAKANEQLVAYAKQLYADGLNQKQVAEAIGLSKSQVQRIVRGQAWLGPQHRRKEGSVIWKKEQREKEWTDRFELPPYR